MEDEQLSLMQQLKHNEDGILYLIIGLASAFLSWFVIPIIGVVAIYCGFKLYQEHEKLIVGGALAIVGFTGVAFWLAWLLTLE